MTFFYHSLSVLTALPEIHLAFYIAVCETSFSRFSIESQTHKTHGTSTFLLFRVRPLMIPLCLNRDRLLSLSMSYSTPSVLSALQSISLFKSL